jgi:hypothetical protein
MKRIHSTLYLSLFCLITQIVDEKDFTKIRANFLFSLLFTLNVLSVLNFVVGLHNPSGIILFVLFYIGNFTITHSQMKGYLKFHNCKNRWVYGLMYFITSIVLFYASGK